MAQQLSVFAALAKDPDLVPAPPDGLQLFVMFQEVQGPLLASVHPGHMCGALTYVLVERFVHIKLILNFKKRTVGPSQYPNSFGSTHEREEEEKT